METSTKVVNVKVAFIRPKHANLKAWMEDPANVYIGRRGIVFVDKVRWPKEDSPWANPFKIDKKATDQNGERGRVLSLYSTYIKKKLDENPELQNELLKLKGKTLGCWCKEKGKDVPCHGDILLELIANYTK